MREVEFVVYGEPIAQGSKTLGHTKPKQGADGEMIPAQAFMREANAAKLRWWRRAIRDEAKLHKVGWVKQSPVVVELTFMHASTKNRPVGFKPTAPDLDKLCRGVLDALQQAGLLVDDAQVVKLLAQKVYGSTPGVRVRVREAR